MWIGECEPGCDIAFSLAEAHALSVAGSAG